MQPTDGARPGDRGSTLAETLTTVETITFDCYGTLIDWKGGLTQFFATTFGRAAPRGVDELFDLYVRTEAAIEAGSYRSYRQVLGEVAQRLAEHLHIDLSPNSSNTLAEALPRWTPFVYTGDALVRLKRRYRLGVLSNIDRDLFGATSKHFPVAFDFVITAEDVRAYKPSPAHFHRLLSEFAERQTTLHVGQSPFHDGIPAGQTGLAFVWINRYKQCNDTMVTPLAELPDLKSLADAADAV